MVALLGLKDGENLFLNSEGRWLGDYVPAWYRAYPFRLFKNDKSDFVICIEDDATTTIAEHGNERIYDENLNVSPAVQEIRKFLTAIAQSTSQTESLCAEIEKHDLFIPWNIEVKSGDESKLSLQGLFRVNEDAINTIGPEHLTSMIKSGAMKLIYAHLLSIQHVDKLGQLYAAQASISKKTELFQNPFSDNETLNFDLL